MVPYRITYLIKSSNKTLALGAARHQLFLREMCQVQKLTSFELALSYLTMLFFSAARGQRLSSPGHSLAKPPRSGFDPCMATHWRAGLHGTCGSLRTQNNLWFKCGVSRNVPTQSAQKEKNLCLSINYLNYLMQPLCSQSAATLRNISNPKPLRTLIITEYAGGTCWQPEQ